MGWVSQLSFIFFSTQMVIALFMPPLLFLNALTHSKTTLRDRHVSSFSLSSSQSLILRNVSFRKTPFRDLRRVFASNGGELKESLFQALEGVDRGIFGLNSAKKSEIEALIEQLESQNPTPEPTTQLKDKVDGSWKLIYSTITILGSKRTKLGLRNFITLGDFFQIINVSEEKAVNVIQFYASGFKMLTGQLKIIASYKISTKARVDITLESSSITPEQLMSLFQKNYDILLAIFNPEGWLEITYVDELLRIGRDDKGNIFVLQKSDQPEI